MAKKFYKEQRNHSAFFIEAAKQIVDWNAIALNASAENYKEFSKNFTHPKFELQISLVKEELKEYRDAFKKNDHVEMLDAAADSFVVGSFLAYMFLGPEVMVEVLSFAVGDHLAPDPYEAFTNGMDIFEKPEQMAYMAAAITRMCRDSLCVCNYDGKAVLTEVLRSNMSKFPTPQALRESHGSSSDEDIENVITKELAWIEATRAEYSDFTVTYNSEYDVYVFHDGNGKIMKPSTFSPANIKQFVEG